MNNVPKILLFSVLASASVMAHADWSANCGDNDSYASTTFQATYGQAGATVPNAPGFCNAINTTISLYKLNSYIPPGACVDYKQLESFTWGAAATLPASSCGGNTGVVENVQSGGNSGTTSGGSTSEPQTTW